MGFSQTLVFFNNQDTITFKKNELIKINGQKYLYQKAIKNQTQIHLIDSGLFKKEHITLDTSKIGTFRKYEWFRFFNCLEIAGFGIAEKGKKIEVPDNVGENLINEGIAKATKASKIKKEDYL